MMRGIILVFAFVMIGCHTAPKSDDGDAQVLSQVFVDLLTRNVTIPAEFDLYVDSLKNVNGNMQHIGDIFSGGKIVLRFNERNCERCIEHELRLVKGRIEDEIVGFATYSTLRAAKIALAKYAVNFPVYYISNADSELLFPTEMESYSAPYWFSIDDKLHAAHIFFPSPDFPVVSAQYLARMTGKEDNPTDIFDTKIVDLGVVKMGSTTKAVFSYTNKQETPLLITNAAASCGCTVAKWNKEPLMPHKSAELIVLFTPNSAGAQLKSIMVRHNQLTHPVKLILKAKVE